MLNSIQGAYASANYHFQDDPRAARLAAEARKLVAAARHYVLSRRDLIPLGDDPLLSQLLSSAGFTRTDVQVQRVGVAGRIVTALAIPTRVWRNPDDRAKLFHIKQEAKALRTACILVPQRWLKSPTRSAVARVLSSARNTYYSTPHRMAVLDHLATNRISMLIEAASVIRDHDDPIGAVLAMTCHGLLEIDRSTPIAPCSWTSLPSWATAAGQSGENR